MQVSHIKHLVLSGGGLLGISYIGLFRYLEERLNEPINETSSSNPSISSNPITILSQLQSISGCSAGAIFGSLLAIGYTASEIEKVVKDMKFKEYININADSIINFMKLKGLESGKNLINFIKKFIKDKTGNENITFGQIQEMFNVKLQIGVCNLTKSKFEMLNVYNSANIPIHLAISASIAIPFIFEPVVIGNEVYCDGGLIESLPIENIIDEIIMLTEDNGSNGSNGSNANHTNHTTKSILGIYLMNQINPINSENYQAISFSHYMSSVMQTLASDYVGKKLKIDKLKHKIDNKIDNSNHKIIIFKIPCDIMTFIKINASQDDIDNIINIAYNTTKKEFEKEEVKIEVKLDIKPDTKPDTEPDTKPEKQDKNDTEVKIPT